MEKEWWWRMMDSVNLVVSQSPFRSRHSTIFSVIVDDAIWGRYDFVRVVSSDMVSVYKQQNMFKVKISKSENSIQIDK